MKWPVRLGRRVAEGSPALSTEGDRNHLITARNEFANAFGDLARGKRNWQVMAFSLAGLVSMLSIAYIRLATSARLVPYVIEIDHLGQIVATGTVEESRLPEQRLIAAELARFIRSIRTVLPAPASPAQAEMMRRAYAFLGQEAAGFLNDYFAHAENDPRVLGTRVTRLVNVSSVLRVPNSDVWKLRWTEEERALQGGIPPRTRAWEGYATVRVVPPASTDAIEDNPLGLRIESLTWTETAEGPAEVSTHGGTTP
jgi:type IV secretory pathway TrbF-like protein